MTRTPAQLSLLGDLPTTYAPSTSEEVEERRARLSKAVEYEEGGETARLIDELLSRGEARSVVEVFIAKPDEIMNIDRDIREWKREGIIPVQVFESAYRSEANLERKSRLALFIDDTERFSALMLGAWESGNLDEAAMLYGVAFSDPYSEDRDALSSAKDNIPMPFLKALQKYVWPDRLTGIQDWLKEEIEERES